MSLIAVSALKKQCKNTGARFDTIAEDRISYSARRFYPHGVRLKILVSDSLYTESLG